MSKLSQLLRGSKRSSTVKIFGGAGVVGFVTWLLEQASVTDFIEADAELSALVTGILSLVAIIQRFRTKESIAEKGAK